MECSQVKDELHPYLRQELTAAQQEQIRQHLGTCQGCAEEAALMKDLDEMIGKSLKRWAAEGICPPHVSQRITVGLRRAARRAWWHTWYAPAGAVVGAAALLLVLSGTQPDMQLTLDSLSSADSLAITAERSVSPDAAYEQGGITLTVRRVDTSTQETHIEYAIGGVPLDAQAPPTAYQPTLVGPGGAVRLKRFTATQQRDLILFQAYFEPVPVGRRLTLHVGSLPLASSNGPWEVSFQN